MAELFGAAYASLYDVVYHDKDYSAECDLIEEAFRRYGRRQVRSVLDMGCGTGGHAIPLAQRGYEVVGVDRASPMLEVARSKAEDAGLTVSFIHGDIASTPVDGTFDAVLGMFAVLGYQTSNEDLLATLQHLRRRLAPGGLLVFDVWYGPAVLHTGPSDRLRVQEDGSTTLIRSSSGQLLPTEQTCQVTIRMWEIEQDHLRSRTEETHNVRYFFPMELELLLTVCGFKLLRLAAFPTLDQTPDSTVWNVLVVAENVG